jgi:hypothetical protein
MHLERQLLWPDVADKPPDIFLSIGTSQQKKVVELRLREKCEDSERVGITGLVCALLILKRRSFELWSQILSHAIAAHSSLS